MKRLTLIPLALSLLILSACGQKEETTGVAAFRYNMPSGGQIIDQKKGKEIWFAYGAISPVSRDLPVNGLAKSHGFEDGSFLHTIQVNIPVAEDGTFYEAWLQNPTTQEKLPIGHLKSILGDARHNLFFETKQDIRGFSKVIITLKPDDGKSDTGKEVASALLKVIERDKK